MCPRPVSWRASGSRRSRRACSKASANNLGPARAKKGAAVARAAAALGEAKTNGGGYGTSRGATCLRPGICKARPVPPRHKSPDVAASPANGPRAGLPPHGGVLILRTAPDCPGSLARTAPHRCGLVRNRAHGPRPPRYVRKAACFTAAPPPPPPHLPPPQTETPPPPHPRAPAAAPPPPPGPAARPPAPSS